MRQTLGILGGLGPLASAKFIETIYSVNSKKVSCEQQLPEIVLYSNPAFPDRTDYLLGGKEKELLNELCSSLKLLLKAGAEKIIICCFTLHHLLPRLPQELQEKVISLPYLLLQEVIKCAKPVVLLCTKGSNLFKVFESQTNWEEASKYIIRIDDEDVSKVHKEIYEIKNRGVTAATHDFVLSMLQKYKTKIWAVGCTEFHLLAAEAETKVQYNQVIDPLITIAKSLS